MDKKWWIEEIQACNTRHLWHMAAACEKLIFPGEPKVLSLEERAKAELSKRQHEVEMNFSRNSPRLAWAQPANPTADSKRHLHLVAKKGK